jgi:hypothetical protein
MMKVGSQVLGFGAGFEELQLQAAEAAGLHLLAEGDDLLLQPAASASWASVKPGWYLRMACTMVRRWKGLDRSSSRPW